MIYHEAVQRKILAESELTLTKAVHIAQAAETARDEAHALHRNTTRRPLAKQVETAFSVRHDTAGGTCKARQLDNRECYRCMWWTWTSPQYMQIQVSEVSFLQGTRVHQ